MKTILRGAASCSWSWAPAKPLPRPPPTPPSPCGSSCPTRWAAVPTPSPAWSAKNCPRPGASPHRREQARRQRLAGHRRRQARRARRPVPGRGRQHAHDAAPAPVQETALRPGRRLRAGLARLHHQLLHRRLGQVALEQRRRPHRRRQGQGRQPDLRHLGPGQRRPHRRLHVPDPDRHPHDPRAVQGTAAALYRRRHRRSRLGLRHRRHRGPALPGQEGQAAGPGRAQAPGLVWRHSHRLEAGGPANFELKTWVALFAPKGTPKAAIDAINNGVAKAVAEPDVRKQFDTFGFEAWPASAADLAQAVKADTQRFESVVKLANITLD